MFFRGTARPTLFGSYTKSKLKEHKKKTLNSNSHFKQMKFRKNIMSRINDFYWSEDD